MRKHLLLTGTLFYAAAQGQEQFGIANSNWAGTDAVPMNPARMATQWPWLDINLVGANLFAWNNHLYLGKQYSLVGELRNGIKGTSGEITIGVDRSERDKKLFVSAEFKGPALAWSLGRTAFGLSMRSRVMTTAVGVPTSLATFGNEGLNYAPQHGIRYQENNFRAVGAAWTEFGGSIARILHAQGNTMISAGLTGKYLMGHAGAALQVDELDFMVVDSARIEVYGARAQYGFAMPGTSAGKGFGADIGVEFQRTENDADGYVPHSRDGGCAPIPYIWRLGVSVMDVGRIKFDDAVAGGMSASTAQIPDYDNIEVDDAEGIDSLFANSFTGWTAGQSLKIGLPTALAIQCDRRITESFFVGANVVQNISGQGSTRLRRTNTVAVVPRYETKRLEAALPVVLHEYRKPTVGLMLRLNNLIVGTDNLLPLVSRQNVYAVDVYMRLKITLFRSPACNGQSSRRATAKPGESSLPCPVPSDR